jgi:hypothetical protein
MNPFLEIRRVRAICDELLQLLEFVHRPSFEAPRVMEDEFVVAPENQLVLDVVHSALVRISKYAPHVPVQYVMTLTPMVPSTWVRSI